MRSILMLGAIVQGQHAVENVFDSGGFGTVLRNQDCLVVHTFPNID